MTQLQEEFSLGGESGREFHLKRIEYEVPIGESEISAEQLGFRYVKDVRSGWNLDDDRGINAAISIDDSKVILFGQDAGVLNEASTTTIHLSVLGKK